MRPLQIAMSAVSIAPEKTLTMRPFLRTRSAGASPRATARSCVSGITSNRNKSAGPAPMSVVTCQLLLRRCGRRSQELGDLGFAFQGFDFAVDGGGAFDEEASALVDGAPAEHAAVDDFRAAFDGEAADDAAEDVGASAVLDDDVAVDR